MKLEDKCEAYHKPAEVKPAGQRGYYITCECGSHYFVSDAGIRAREEAKDLFIGSIAYGDIKRVKDGHKREN